MRRSVKLMHICVNDIITFPFIKMNIPDSVFKQLIKGFMCHLARSL